MLTRAILILSVLVSAAMAGEPQQIIATFSIVAVDPETFALDAEGTERLRAARAP